MCAPASASAEAVARPIPRDAPVTKAVLLRRAPISLTYDSNERFYCQVLSIQATGTASDTSARAALAQSSSFCTVGAPLSPIAPTTSPFTLMGNPPPTPPHVQAWGCRPKETGRPG